MTILKDNFNGILSCMFTLKCSHADMKKETKKKSTYMDMFRVSRGGISLFLADISPCMEGH